MTNNEITGNKVVSSDFLKVLLTLKNTIKKELNVAELGIVQRIDNDNIYCTLLNNNQINIQCIKLKDLELNIGDCVLIIFTNSNFKVNLLKYRNNQVTQVLNTNELHTTNNGVIIGII